MVETNFKGMWFQIFVIATIGTIRLHDLHKGNIYFFSSVASFASLAADSVVLLTIFPEFALTKTS